MIILLFAISICFYPLIFAIGFNLGIDKQNELKEFNKNKYRYLNQVLFKGCL